MKMNLQSLKIKGHHCLKSRLDKTIETYYNFPIFLKTSFVSSDFQSQSLFFIREI